MDKIEAFAALASFVLALVIFIQEIRKISDATDLKPIQEDIERIIVKELPKSFTRFLLDRKKTTIIGNNDDTAAELAKDKIKKDLRELLSQVEYLKYIRPYIYEAIRSKDTYLRLIIDNDDITDKDLKLKIKDYIVFLNTLLKGNILIYYLAWKEHKEESLRKQL